MGAYKTQTTRPLDVFAEVEGRGISDVCTELSRDSEPMLGDCESD